MPDLQQIEAEAEKRFVLTTERDRSKNREVSAQAKLREETETQGTPSDRRGRLP